jgi:isocitrate dehydrogenase
MELINDKGDVRVLKDNMPLLEGEIIDSMFMSKKALVLFFKDELRDAKLTGNLILSPWVQCLM